MITSITKLGSVGVIKDLPDHDLSVDPMGWSSVSNMRFKAGLVERAPGYAAGFTTPTQTLYGLFAAYKVDGSKYIVGCGTTKCFSYTEDEEVEITGTTTPAATADTRWTGGLLTGYLIVNNASTVPQYIDVEQLGSATNLADLTNWPATTTCGVLRPWKYFLIAGNLVEDGNTRPFKVRWSESAEPGQLPASWTPTTSNDSGDVDLDAGDGQVIDFVPFGDQLAIYQERAITLMRYIGGTDAANRFVMAFNRIPVGATGGMIANNCGVDVAGVGHVVMSSSDVYVFNGTSVKSILDNRLRNWLFANLDQTMRKRCFVLNSVRDSEVLICFPTWGDTTCTKAIIWNYNENTLGIRDLPNATAGIYAEVTEEDVITWTNVVGTWSSITYTWDSLFAAATAMPKTVLAGSAPKIYIIGSGNDNDGDPLVAEVVRKYITIGGSQRVKYFSTVWPRFDAAPDQQIEISIGTSMNVNEEPVWQDAKLFTAGSSRKIDVNRSGRFLSFMARSNSGAPWRIMSLDVDVRPQGLW